MSCSASASSGRASARSSASGMAGGAGRAPGWGEVDWAAFISALIEVGYEGNIDIEHEDDVLAFQ